MKGGIKARFFLKIIEWSCALWIYFFAVCAAYCLYNKIYYSMRGGFSGFQLLPQLFYKYSTVSAAESSSLFWACGSQSNETAELHTFLMRTCEVSDKKLYSWLRWLHVIWQNIEIEIAWSALGHLWITCLLINGSILSFKSFNFNKSWNEHICVVCNLKAVLLWGKISWQQLFVSFCRLLEH